jgi:hypothetical protein
VRRQGPSFRRCSRPCSPPPPPLMLYAAYAIVGRHRPGPMRPPWAPWWRASPPARASRRDTRRRRTPPA